MNWTSFCLKLDNHIENKIKTELNWPSYAAKSGVEKQQVFYNIIW